MPSGFTDELVEIEQLAADCLNNDSADTGTGPNVKFLDNGYVLCLPRTKGDSRYVYGDDGFNFWIHASGYMYANEGLYSLFMRRKEGDEPVISFFAGLPNEDGKTFTRISLLPVPVIEESDVLIKRRYTIMNNSAAYFFTEFSSIKSVVRISVDKANKMIFSVHIENKGNETVSIYTSSYFKPFCRYDIYESDEDRWFSETILNNSADNNGDFAAGTLEVAQDEDRFHSNTYYAVLRGKYTPGKGIQFVNRDTNTSRQNFVGNSQRNLGTSIALKRGKFSKDKSLTTFTDIAVFSDINSFNLAENTVLRLDYTYQIAPDKETRDTVVKTPLNPREIDTNIASTTDKNKTMLSSLNGNISGLNNSLNINEKFFNAFFDHLKYQVSVCGLLKGYMQLELRSLIGIRDVFQALEALQYYRTDESRNKMIEALGFTIPTGRCVRQYSLPPGGSQAGRADLRPFIDQGVWVISTIHSYLQNTGDKDFLETEVGYHDIIDEGSETILPSDKRDSVLMHIFRIMDYLNENRDHSKTKLLLALYGDWNDALDGLGIANDPEKDYGTGVSVMTTLQYYQNCLEMIKILNSFYPGKYEEKINQYRETADSIAENLIKYAVISDEEGNKRIVHGWGDERSYFVGSFNDPDGVARDGLTSYSFWIISEMLEKTPELEQTILDAFERMQSKYGLMTFNPAFPKGTEGVGRIPKLPPGTAENGAAYIHATLFAIWAYFKMGQPQKAWDQIEKILPFTNIHDRYTHSPYVMPNSYVYNPEKGLDGESMNDWQTGSSNVLLKIMIWYVFGYRPDFDGIYIQPASWTPFEESNFSTRSRGKVIEIVYKKESTADKRAFSLNGQDPITGDYSSALKTNYCFIPYEELSDKNTIMVIDPG